ncbi:MAG: dihydrofolate reductase family protein, partial [Methanomicrobiales archaeon]|nr:dihydrofolate reductase family protein [Methanomicrobiales archaeon]
GALFRAHLVDELYTYIGNFVIGGDDAPTLFDGTGFLREEEFVRFHCVGLSPLDEGILIQWKTVEK